MAFIVLTEIFLDVFRPLIDLGEQHTVRKVGVELGSEALKDFVRFRKVLVAGAFPFDEVRH
jgi:hypothetical protein